MNNKRRKALGEARTLIEQAASIVEEVTDEEQEALDNTPENLQESERYYNMENTLDDLYCLHDSLSDITGQIEELEK